MTDFPPLSAWFDQLTVLPSLFPIKSRKDLAVRGHAQPQGLWSLNPCEGSVVCAARLPSQGLVFELRC
jgi:hypothetical protein